MPKVSKKQTVRENKGFLSNIKLGDSYTSLIVGVIVVILVTLVVFAIVKAGGTNSFKNIDTLSTDTNILPKTYEVKEGDDLWSIAEKIYGSGYNWVDLAKENKLSNPEVLYVGSKLSVPNVKVKNPQKKETTMEKEESTKEATMKKEATDSITSDKYTVLKGDNLWDISVRAYGDGYKWVEVAKANNLSNPDLIYPGNIIKLSR